MLDKVRRAAVTQMPKYFTSYFIYCEKILALIFIPKLTADELTKKMLAAYYKYRKIKQLYA